MYAHAHVRYVEVVFSVVKQCESENNSMQEGLRLTLHTRHVRLKIGQAGESNNNDNCYETGNGAKGTEVVFQPLYATKVSIFAVLSCLVYAGRRFVRIFSDTVVNPPPRGRGRDSQEVFSKVSKKFHRCV